MLDEVLGELQTKLTRFVLGQRDWVARDLAKQRHCDAGIDLIDVRAAMAGAWGMTIRRALSPEDRPFHGKGPKIHFGPKTFYEGNISFAEIDLFAKGYSFCTIQFFAREIFLKEEFCLLKKCVFFAKLSFRNSFRIFRRFAQNPTQFENRRIQRRYGGLGPLRGRPQSGLFLE